MRVLLDLSAAFDTVDHAILLSHFREGVKRKVLLNGLIHISPIEVLELTLVNTHLRLPLCHVVFPRDPF